MKRKQTLRDLQIAQWHAANDMAIAARMSLNAPKSQVAQACYDQMKAKYETITRAINKRQS